MDFTEENGATRVAPGSHNTGQHPNDALDDPMASQPDEIRLTGSAGTVVIFNSHLWNAGTVNHTETPRLRNAGRLATLARTQFSRLRRGVE